MRGSAFVKLRVWQVNRDGSINKQSADIEYGHSKVRDMNTNYQREENFNFAKNQAIKQYRNTHQLSSDTEVNYHLLASGIINKTKINGKQVRNIKSLRITPQRKRHLHKTESFLGKNKSFTQLDINKEIMNEDKEMTKKEYHGTKRKVSNKYIIDTGKVKKPKYEVKSQTERGYYGSDYNINGQDKEKLSIIVKKTKKKSKK